MGDFLKISGVIILQKGDGLTRNAEEKQAIEDWK